jgi:hypothetical protein
MTFFAEKTCPPVVVIVTRLPYWTMELTGDEIRTLPCPIAEARAMAIADVPVLLCQHVSNRKL